MRPPIPMTKKVWNPIAYCIAFGFGSGLMPFAPGTWGTLAAIPLYYLLSITLPVTYLSITGVCLVAGIWITDYVSKDMGIHDFGGIVWDEIVGFFITMFLVPCSVITILVGFFLFRLFDIWKPWPIGWLDKSVQGGLGIMLDDVLAAIYANVVLHSLSSFGLFQVSFQGFFS